MSELRSQIEQVLAEAQAGIPLAVDLDALRALESSLAGRNGRLTGFLKQLGSLPAADKPAIGKLVNEAKAQVERLLTERRAALEQAAVAQSLAGGDFDPTEPGVLPRLGTLHPITQITHELVDVFGRMGFTWLDGPEIESEHYNFDALNIPSDHPARENMDTFWLTDGNLLRTHTSPVQVRAMEKFKPPIKVIVPGRCFRSETVDMSHEHTFYQMEGLVVDRGISVANLIHTLKTCVGEILQSDLPTRFRPGFFPFVEPGFEMDARCRFCGGKGCSVCKQSGWIEVLPCGMVHPNVLAAGGIDPEEFTGFAFGMGLQRMVMIRFGIDDIRTFMGGDLRFLSQFPGAGV
jgi:phenylalanyl-tRNA synthetase alpha chain